MKQYIQLKKDNILRIGIKDSDGKETGESLEFDLEDIELPLKLNQCEYEHRKNLEYLKMQSATIDKKEDRKGKFVLSFNEKEKLNLLKNFYKREEYALDLFLGDGGTKKMLNGRKPYYNMFDDISEVLEPIMPLLNVKMEDIEAKIKSKYSDKKEENTLE